MNPAVYPNNPIVFPGLGFQINPDPILVSFGPFTIHWYGVLIAVGFLLAALYAFQRGPKFGVKSDHFTNILLIATPVSIVFARIYYVIFNLSLYANNPMGVFEIWNGGIAIYGAVIGAVGTVFVYCKVAKISALNVLDIGALGLLIGQCVGRWGNFINREAFGGMTDWLWRMEVYDAAELARLPVHPAFLYESLWTLIGFVFLHFYSKKRHFSGEVFLLYLAWYGLGRAFIEGLRTDSIYFWNSDVRVSQVLAALSCAAALILWVYFRFVRKPGLRTDKCDLLAAEASGEAAETDGDSAETADAASPGEETPSDTDGGGDTCGTDLPHLADADGETTRPGTASELSGPDMPPLSREDDGAQTAEADTEPADAPDTEPVAEPPAPEPADTEKDTSEEESV